MGQFDDIIENEQYKQGFEDGKEDYKEMVLSKFSNFVDEIIDKEVNTLLPQVLYRVTELQRENQQLYRLYKEKEEMVESLYIMNEEKEEDIEKLRGLLIDSKEEILKLRKGLGVQVNE